MTELELTYELATESSEFEQATAMSEWLPDYLYTALDKPNELPELTVERLARHFGEFTTLGLDMLRDEMLMMPRNSHADIFLYLCGFPEESVKDRLRGTYAEVIALIDERFPPIEDVAEIEQSEELPKSQFSAFQHLLPIILNRDEKWKRDAECRDIDDPDTFFPPLSDPAIEQLKICAKCDVREQCLKYALQRNEAYGVWGGKTADERRAIRREAHEERIAGLLAMAEALAKSARTSA